MLTPMSPADSVFLMVETREHPMHVGGLQLFAPPDGADAQDVHDLLREIAGVEEVRPLFARRAYRSVRTGGWWAWTGDSDFDASYHVRHVALPHPGRILELLALCSRLHGHLLDRHRPLWEAYLIEGLADGRFAVYFKVHHAVVDGVAAQRLLQRSLSEDPDTRGMLPPWGRGPDGPPKPEGATRDIREATARALRSALEFAAEAAGLPVAFARTISRGLREETAPVSFAAPRTMLNVPITGSRRFAAQSWPMERIRRVGKAADVTVNDVVLAMCSGALRAYLNALDALPEAPLIAMVPVSLHVDDSRESGNAVGLVMCNLATDLPDAAGRLAAIHDSMAGGKAALAEMSPLQILAMSALGLSPLALAPLLGSTSLFRPPFNLVISNVPGPSAPLYLNGARLDGLYPLSIPFDGQALNITCTSYADELAFGLTGCRRSVPHLQRLLGHLDDELAALERAAGLA